jgi:TRAP-type transport system small permease protein
MSALLSSILWLQKAVIAACSLLIALTFGAVVILRYGFEANLFAYEEWMLVAAFVLYFIGGAQGSYERSHIRADLIGEWVQKPRMKWALEIFVLGLEVAVGAVLTYWGLLMLAEDLAKYPLLPATAVYGIPLAVPRGTIFLGFLLMTIYAALHLCRQLAEGPGRAPAA